MDNKQTDKGDMEMNNSGQIYRIIPHYAGKGEFRQFTYCNVNMLQDGKWVRAIGGVSEEFATEWVNSRIRGK